MEQLSLFDLDKAVEEIQSEPTPAASQTIIASVIPVKKKPVVPDKPVLSEETIKQLNAIENLDDLCHFMSTDTCYLSFQNYYGSSPGYKVDIRGARRLELNNNLMDEALSVHIRLQRSWEHEEKQTMVFFDKEGNAWSRICKINYINGNIYNRRELPERFDIKLGWEGSKWRLLTSLPSEGVIFLQTEHVRKHIFHDTMPYTYKYFKEGEGQRFSMELLMLCPQIELLDKAGYSFVDQLTYYPQRIDSNEVTCFNRLIKFERNPGKLQNIFKTTKEVCKILKKEHKLEEWDRYRKLEKFSKTSPDELQQIYDHHYNDNELANIQSILKQQYHNKYVFSFPSLVNYLNRVDQYEAIEATEALQLIRDYLASCRLLDMEPRIDGDSLKREHDIAARLVRHRRNEIATERMQKACANLQKYNYENNSFIIRGIRNYEDLLDEAKQQHNCVASYSSSIVQGSSLIFVMRRKTVPNRSFVTIELSPDLSTVRQKYEACNTPLRNKEATDFIDEWQRHCKAVAKGQVEPHILSIDMKPIEQSGITNMTDDAIETEDEIDI